MSLFNNILNENKNISHLQIQCIKELSNIFDQSYIENFLVDDCFYNGTFGNLQGKEVYAINIKFLYKSYNYEFIIAYNQLEYYIYKNGEIIFECNLEDFWKDDILLNKYLSFLKIDLKKLI